MRYAALIAASLAASACGPSSLPIEVVNEVPASASPSWLLDANMESDTIATASTAADVWGGSMSDLEHAKLTIRWKAGVLSCGGYMAVGCTSDTGEMWDSRMESAVTVAYFGTVIECAEASALAHEIGHVLINDGGHDDPRWCSASFWSRMVDALERLTSEPTCIAQLEYLRVNAVQSHTYCVGRATP